MLQGACISGPGLVVDGTRITEHGPKDIENGRKRNRKRGPYKKKHLTGNAYYAMKAKQNAHKNFYYYEMGKKGGRPRMYNRIEQ